jgi:hypothetical protein
MVQRETPSTSATGKDPTKVLIIEHEGDGLDDLVGSMLSRSRNVAITMQPCSPRGDANWVRTTLSGRPRFFWRDSGLTAALGAAGRASPDLIVLIVLNPFLLRMRTVPALERSGRCRHYETSPSCSCLSISTILGLWMSTQGASVPMAMFAVLSLPRSFLPPTML